MERTVGGREGRAQRRPLLATIIALGGVISLAGANGVFATITDRATTGTNSVESAGLARSADLQLALGTPAAGNTMTCGTFADDLATAVMTASNLPVGGGIGATFVCLRNNGSRTVSVVASAIELVDTDTGCTGDESTADLSCGGDLVGELSPYLTFRETDFSCDDTTAFVQTPPASLAALTSTPLSLFSLAPGAVRCLSFGGTYDASEAEALVSQSDTSTWRFAFDGSTT